MNHKRPGSDSAIVLWVGNHQSMSHQQEDYIYIYIWAFLQTNTVRCFTFYIWSVLRVFSDSQVVRLSGFPPQQVPHPLVVDLEVAEATNQKT